MKSSEQILTEIKDLATYVWGSNGHDMQALVPTEIATKAMEAYKNQWTDWLKDVGIQKDKLISSLESENESLQNTITQLQQSTIERSSENLQHLANLALKDDVIQKLMEAFLLKLKSDSIG